MAFNIGAIVTVGGEKEFNAAMKNMQQSMKYVSAEANAAMSAFGANEKSVESLTAKNNELKKALDVQRQGVASIKTELDKLVAAGLDPASEKYKQLKANLDNVTASANKTEQEIKDNEAAMAKLTEKSSGLGDTIKGMAEKLGVTLPAGAQKGIDALNKVSASTVVFVGATVKAISTLVDYSFQAAKTADDIMTLSSTTGMTTDKIQELEYSSELLDVSFETVSGSMTKMIRSMNTARQGSGDAADAYRKLHVSVSGAGGQLRDANDVFYDVIDRLGRMKNETERDAISMQIFGKSARELNPLIEAGSAKIKEFADEAHKMGYVMDQDTLARLGQLDDAFQRFSKQADTVKNTLAMALLPVITLLVETLSKVDPKVIATVAILGTITITVIAVIKAVKDVTGIFGTFSAASLKTTAIILGVVAALIALAAIIAVIAGKGNDLDRAMSSIGTNVSKVNSTIPKYAAGTSSHPGGLAVVGDAGPELVDLSRGARVYSNADTRRMLAAVGGDTFYVTIDAKNVREFNDIVHMAQSARQQRRAGGR